MSSPESQITPNLFLSSTKSVSSDSAPPTTVFFISGNPGLVSYYHDFLSLVSEKLASSSSPGKDGSSGFRIYGANLGGFEINEKEKANAHSARLYNVEEQIDFVEKKLHILINESESKSESEMNRRVTRSRAAAEQSPKQKVILIGHSVGTYIAMEILRRHREEKIEDKDEVPFDIIGAVLLFPTVMEIAKSAAGTRLTVCIYSPFHQPLLYGDIVPDICILVATLSYPPTGPSRQPTRQVPHFRFPRLGSSSFDQTSDERCPFECYRDYSELSEE
jgi:pimeloyl-ACP methyl ester carboxylesterase